MIIARQSKKRPTGIVVLAVLWTLVSVYNIYQGLNIIVVDLGFLPYISDPRAPEWLSFGLPAEIVLGFFVVAFGFLTILVVYGLYTAKSWSYHFALAIPIFIMVINVATVGLYASAPPELELGESIAGAIPPIVGNLVWLVIIWSYLRQPHVKQYLNVIPAPAPVTMPVPPSAPPVPPPPPTVFVTMSTEKKFCRYCGAENKIDADFCEKCGRNIA